MASSECRKARKRPIPFNCKSGAGHVGNCSPYTLPPQAYLKASVDMTTEYENDLKARDQYQGWLMRHGHHWNDVRSQTADACVAADHAEAVDAIDARKAAVKAVVARKAAEVQS